MLLLTAAPGVQEWDDLTKEMENQVSSEAIQEFLDGFRYTETYVWARPEPHADAERVTHWTSCNDSADRHQLAEWFGEQIGEYGTDLVGEVVGCGNFSVVFACPWDDDKVIKLGHGGMCDIGDIYGDGWLEYALYSMKRSREGVYNPLLPTIHKLYVSDNEDWFVALIDRYAGTFDSPDVTDDMRCKMRTVRSILGRGGYSLPSTPDVEYMAYAKQLIADPLFPRCSDMHEGNFMFMDDGRVIVTDPSSGTGQPRHEIERTLRQIGILMPDPLADAEAEARMKRQRHDEVRSNNQARMNVKAVYIPKLIVCSEGIVRFDDMPTHVNVAMEAMGKMIMELRKDLPYSKNIAFDRNWQDMGAFGQMHRFLAIDPSKPIDIRKVA